MGLIDDRFGLWMNAPDGAFAAPPGWSWQSPPAPLLQGTAGLPGAGSIHGDGVRDASGMAETSTGSADTTSAPLALAPPPVPLPQPRPASAPSADAMSGALAPSDATAWPGVPSAASDPSLFDRLSAAAHNFRPTHQGIIPGLFDAASGLMSGRRLDPAGQAQQAQNQTVAALQSRGLAPDVADAVARNPDLMRQVAAQLFGPKQYQRVVVRDAQGNIVPLTFDAASGQYRDANGKVLPPGAFTRPTGR